MTTPLIVQAMIDRLGIGAEVVDDLAKVHASQWGLENRCRDPDAGDDVVAATKREIDRSNARRHDLIDAIDASGGLHRTTLKGRRYSQTVGELIDVMLVLQIKIETLSRLAGEERLSEARRVECAAQLSLCQRKARHMSQTAEQLMADISAGRASLPPRADPKLYNDDELRELSSGQASLGRLIRS